MFPLGVKMASVASMWITIATGAATANIPSVAASAPVSLDLSLSCELVHKIKFWECAVPRGLVANV